MKSSIKSALTAGLAIGAVVASTGASAISITATQDANGLVSALLVGVNTGIVVTGATLSGHTTSVTLSGQPLGTFTSSGTYSNASNTYGIGPGVVLSTGGVTGVSFMGSEVFPGYEDGPNSTDGNGIPYGASFEITDLPDPNDPPPGAPASVAQEALLDPITQNPACDPGPDFCSHFDVTELIINFDMQTGFDRVGFKIVFGSEEFPDFVGDSFIDGFGMFLNGVNIAQVGGNPVNINHPDMTGTITGTELNGILAPGGNPVLTFGGLVNPTGNTLRFIVGDTADGILDTTVYFSALAGAVVPAPPAIWLLGTAALGLVGRGYAQRRQRAADAT